MGFIVLGSKGTSWDSSPLSHHLNWGMFSAFSNHPKQIQVGRWPCWRNRKLLVQRNIFRTHTSMKFFHVNFYMLPWGANQEKSGYPSIHLSFNSLGFQTQKRRGFLEVFYSDPKNILSQHRKQLREVFAWGRLRVISFPVSESSVQNPS